MQLARERLKFIFSQSAYFFEAPNYTSTSFQDILIDLSCYESNQLVQGSLHLLNRFYSAEVTLFQKAIQTQLLVTEESQRVFGEIRQLLPTLRRHLSVDAGESQRAEIIRILNSFTQMCSLQEDNEQPHQQNQNILYNFGELHSLTHSLTHPSTNPPTHSPTPLLARALTHSLAHSSIHQPPHPLTLSLAHSLTHSFTHSLSH